MDSERLIFVTGSPHSGTTILRKIIGNHKEVSALEREISLNHITKDSIKGINTKFIVAKSPHCDDNFCDIIRSYTKTKAVCVVRHPLEVFASLKMRFAHENKTQIEQRMVTWIKHNINCISLRNESRNNVMVIKYENLFHDNHIEVKNLFEWLGLDYYPEIISQNQNIPSKVNWNGNIPKTMPERTKQEAFRTYQINQPFLLAESKYKKVFSQDQIDSIVSNEYISDIMQEFGYEQ